MFKYYVIKFSQIFGPPLCQHCQDKSWTPTPHNLLMQYLNRRWVAWWLLRYVSNYKDVLFYYHKEYIWGWMSFKEIRAWFRKKLISLLIISVLLDKTPPPSKGQQCQHLCSDPLVSIKKSSSFCFISPATMIYLKGDIHSSVWSTKTFVYDIWEPR